MTTSRQIQAVIFDMDNTILQSHIDFFKMKKVVFELLVRQGMLSPDLPWQKKTASQLIELGRKHPDFPLLEQQVWKLVQEVESQGMEQVELEPFAFPVLEHLRSQDVLLTVLTNNAYDAAVKALKRCMVFHFFDYVAGREQMEELKPSPSGIHHILEKCRSIPQGHWLMVGDSWIDGMAAKQAGIRFIAYHTDPEELAGKGVIADGHIQSLQELENWL